MVILRYFEHFWPYLLFDMALKKDFCCLGLIQRGEDTGCAFVVAVLFPEKHMVDGHRCLDPVDFQTHPHRNTASFESSI